MIIEAGGVPLLLLPGRAAFLTSSKTLVVADLHLGKSATFRARGLAVPEGSSATDLVRLEKLIALTGATRLVIAGDLIHASDGWTDTVASEFQNWLSDQKIPTTLTEGNHDQRAKKGLHSLPLDIVESLEINGLVIAHDPENLHAEKPGIAGHLHPGVKVHERGRSSIRMSGFLLKNSAHLVLPAFSEFTGTQIITSTVGDRFFVEIRETITELPAEIW